MKVTAKKKKLLVFGAVLAGFAGVIGFTGMGFAEGQSDPSSECIKCHTDLEEMDDYGAAAAGGAAAIAG